MPSQTGARTPGGGALKQLEVVSVFGGVWARGQNHSPGSTGKRSRPMSGRTDNRQPNAASRPGQVNAKSAPAPATQSSSVYDEFSRPRRRRRRVECRLFVDLRSTGGKVDFRGSTLHRKRDVHISRPIRVWTSGDDLLTQSASQHLRQLWRSASSRCPRYIAKLDRSLQRNDGSQKSGAAFQLSTIEQFSRAQRTKPLAPLRSQAATTRPHPETFELRCYVWSSQRQAI
jgi:hypothetical protein